MTVEEVYVYFNRNWSNVCRDLKLGKNTSRNWVKKGYIPIHTQLRIEKLTNGALIADIDKKED